MNICANHNYHKNLHSGYLGQTRMPGPM